MNVLCLGSEVVGAELAGELVRAFLQAHFVKEERYVRRLEKVERLEKEAARRSFPAPEAATAGGAAGPAHNLEGVLGNA
jgi:hypothetical protein